MKYDVQAIINDLRGKEEMQAEQHDGCYELMTATVQAYAKLPDLLALDFKDLNLVYLTTVGTWSQGIDAKKKMVDESHLASEYKQKLKESWDRVWEKASRHEYNNNATSEKDDYSIGLFGTGFFSFKRSTSSPTSEQVSSFIQMLIDILPMTDDEAMFKRAESVFKMSIPGMQTAAASMILHCLKPYSFPILNTNTGYKNIFEIIGVNLTKTSLLETYIDNCRKIKAFRDQNFSVKNYRIFDMEAREIDKFAIASRDDRKTWLLTWNVDNWQWEGYAEKCAATREGQTITDSWTCSSTKPQIGDEVFLIKLGDKPKCLVGHGRVVRESYDKEHLDPVKAAEGKTAKHIDVEFDRLIDYDHEKYISQEELNSKCSAQHWSPQNSGIEIKPEVLPTLYALWNESTTNTSSNDWWPSLAEYDPGLTADEYHDLFLNEKVVKRPWLVALYELYQMPGHLGTCKQLADKYGYKPGHYISFLSSAADNIAKETNCPLTADQEGSKYWPVLFVGRYVSDKSQGSYCWKMREPVVEAIETLVNEGTFNTEESEPMTKIDHNTILYGPPGTGKTYNSVLYAVALCEGKDPNEVKAEPYTDVLKRYNAFKEAGQIAFTTFHQSYGYEEFIEGIKPKLGEDDDKLGYTIEDGVFKTFCNRAMAIRAHSRFPASRVKQPKIWGMILGGAGMTDLKKQCFEKNEIRLGWSEIDDDSGNDYADDNGVSWQGKHMVYDFKNTMEVGDIVVIEKTNKSIDAIGIVSGDYSYDKSRGRYPRSREVVWLVKDVDEDITGYLPNGRKQLSRYSLFAFDYIGIKAILQILSKYRSFSFIDIEQETKPYVFIIDEINRGNISKIFGELITLIEDTKRAGASEAM